METLSTMTMIIIAVASAIFVYRYIISRQRLKYDKKINIELLSLGIIINAVFTLMNLSIDLFVLKSLPFFKYEVWHFLFSILYSLLFVGITYLVLYKKVLKPEHYINKYDISIYSLSLAIGYGISNVILTSFFEDGIRSVLFIFSYIVVPLSYMMIMSYFLVRLIQKKKNSLRYALLLPFIILLSKQYLYISPSWLGVFRNMVFELFALAIFSTLFLSAVRRNVQFEGINVEEQLDRFDNEKTLHEKISYRFDTFMSYGKLAITGIIFAVGIAVVIVVAIIITIETPEITNGSVTKTLWLSFMRVLDPGNVATDPDFNNPKFVVITTFATFIGLALIATYIGMVSGDFSARIEKLREGNSKVLERKHILIIGFCEDTLSIIENLIKFKDPKRRLNIVIVSSISRKEVENQIIAYRFKSTKDKIVCRTGDLLSMNTLINMGITHASKLIIVGDKKDQTVRIAMAVSSILKPERYDNIEVQVMADTEKDLHLVKSVFGNRMKIFSRQDLDFDPVIRSTALKEYLKLYGSLVGADGDLIISLLKVKKCVGKSFGEIVNAFSYSTVIGIEHDGDIMLNPSKDVLITDAHKMIMLTNSGIAPDFIKADKKVKVSNIDKNKNINYVNESVNNLLIIGDRYYNQFSLQMKSENPNINQFNVEVSNDSDNFHLLDELMISTPPDIVVFLGVKALSDSDNDDLALKVLAYIDAKYNRKKNNYVVAGLINSVQDSKFAYELDYIDMAIENDKCRKMALEILDEHNMITRVEQHLFEAGDRIGAVLAEAIVGTEEITIADVYRSCTQHNIVLVGYIIREGGMLNIVLNPNKNAKVCFDDDDLLLVIK